MHEPRPIQARQAVGAAVIGNVLECYDFAVYAFLAGIIGKNFFHQPLAKVRATPCTSSSRTGG
jgi:MHS family proline/betaine transporter-like MFS transporter